MSGSNRYKIRTHESGDHDGATGEGIMVLHIGGSVALEAESIHSVETLVRKQVSSGKLSRGSVYQICPCRATGESPKSLAVDLTGQVCECLLESANGFCSEFRRIRYNSFLPSANVMRAGAAAA